MHTPLSITLRVGQPVPWRFAASGRAQVDELRRTNVRIVYLTRGRKTRFRVLPAHRVAELVRRQPDLLPIDNPLGRGVRPKSKTYVFHHPSTGAMP